ncbi:hypothetical protein ACB092_04G021000 [Castanea dentata]
MSSYEELFSQINPDETSAIEKITDAYVTLLGRVSEVKHSIPKCGGNNNGASSSSGSSNFNNRNSHAHNNDYAFMCNQFDKLNKDLNQIRDDFRCLQDLVKKPIKNFEQGITEIVKKLEQTTSGSFTTKQVRDMLSSLENHVMKLRFHIPSLPSDMASTSSDVRRYTWKKLSNSEVDEKLPILHINHKFLRSSVFTELQEAFEELNTKLKHCLLCFAVVPENEVVKRRLLIDWWVGERLVDSPATEDVADEIIIELMAKGFIEPVKQRRKLVADRFKMLPRVRCVVIMLAQDAGLFDYDFNGNPTANSSLCSRLFLLKAEDGSSDQILSSSRNFDPEKLQTLFNFNEPFPDWRLESLLKENKDNIVDWFSKMKNVNVLYLGRWQSSGEYHIEVESIDFLKAMMNMKCLRLLSLQGVSRINELPKSVCKLTNLRILDLKACHNLEALPDWIDLLKQLTRLDISECYLLDGIPKRIAHLSKLEVLKGFLIGNLKSGGRSCTLEDLIGLERLSNLSINTSSRDFPTEEELRALSKLKVLRKLGIAWGMKQENAVPKPEQENAVPKPASTVNSDNRGQDSGASRPTRRLSKRIPSLPKTRDPETLVELPTTLEKLKLQCLPHRESPNWLIPEKLKNLKTLYIRGGELKNFVQKGNDKWAVEILHLKYLDEFNMNWEALHESFPNLIFLENVACRNLAYDQCDDGVWRKL